MSCRRCIATVTIRSPDPTRLGPPIAPCACSSCVDRRAFPSRFLCVCLSVCACLWCPLAVRCGGRAAPPQRRRSCAVSDCTRTHQCSFIPPPPPRCSSPPSLVVGCIYSERRPCGGCSGCGTSVVCNLSVKSKRLRSDASPLWLLEAAGRPGFRNTGVTRVAYRMGRRVLRWVAAAACGGRDGDERATRRHRDEWPNKNEEPPPVARGNRRQNKYQTKAKTKSTGSETREARRAVLRLRL